MKIFTSFQRLQTSVLKTTLTLFLMLIAASVANAQNTPTIYESGRVADGEWYLYTDGTLTFSEYVWSTPDYNETSKAPWAAYNSDIKTIDFCNMEFIGNYAFDGCQNLQSITAPHVSYVGKYAFRNCSSLTRLYLPEATSIEEKSFFSCTSLTSAILPKLESTSDMCFGSCEKLSSVTFGSSLKTIYDGTFWECTALTSIVIPDRVTTIGQGAFYKCRSLASVTLGKNVSSIGMLAFQGAFKNATNPTIVVNGPAPTLDATAFDGVTKEDIALKIPKEYSDSYWDITGWRGFNQLTYPQSGTNPKWEITIDGTLTLYGNTPDYSVAKDAPWYGYADYFDKVVTASNVSYVGKLAFFDYPKLKSISLPNVEQIGQDAFSSCKNLTSVFLGNTLRTIGPGVFFDCRSLPSIVIPDNVTSIGQGAFANCKNLNTISFGKNMTSIGAYTFMSCFKEGTTTKNIYVSGQVPTTPNDVFDDVTCANVNLYVPSEYSSGYKNHSVWKNFKFVDLSSDSRKIVTRIVATSDLASFAVEGDTVAGCIPTFTIEEGTPARFNSNQYNGRWQKKEGDKWVTSQSGVNPTFTLGTWRYSCQVRIDGNSGTTHRLAKDAEIYVDGQRWAETSYPAVEPTYSYINVYSSEITVTPRIDPIGITLREPVVYLYSKGEASQLTYVISPSDATEQDVTWVSTDTTVATVSPTGLVRAKNRGKSYVYVSTSNGKKDVCQVICDILPCDVNGDRLVNTADVVAIYSYIMDGDNGDFTKEEADVNGDGSVNTADVVKVYYVIINGDDTVTPIPVDPEPPIIN